MISSRPLVRLAAPVAFVVVMASCSSDDDGFTTPAPTDRVAEPSTTAAPTTSSETSLPVALADAEVTLVEVARAETPLAVATHPVTGELWVAERAGRVRRIGSDGSLTEPVVDISDRVSTDGERGLLGLAFSPDGRHLYLSSTDLAGDTVVEELTVGDSGGVSGGRVLLQVDQPASNHNGGQVGFGPDGFLYIGLGDGGGAGDPRGNGQNRSTILGSILRIDPSTGDPYAVPETNPFVAEPDSRPEIWLYGLRNPWRWSFDVDGSMWVADVGQSAVEEITRVPPGSTDRNLGWNLREGDREFAGPEPPDHVPPVLTYTHDDTDGCGVTGGYVYRGRAIPELVGSYVYADLCRTAIRAFQIDDPSTDRSLEVAPEGRPVLFAVDADGEILVLSQAGPIYRLAPA